MHNRFNTHLCLDCGSINTVGVQGYNIHIEKEGRMVLRRFQVMQEKDGTFTATCKEESEVKTTGTHLLRVLGDLKEQLSIPAIS